VSSTSPRLRVAALLLLAPLLVAGCGDDKPKAKEATAAQLVQAGLAATQQGDQDAAISAFTGAAKKDPHNVFAHYNLGTIFQKQGNNVLALQEYGLALASDPKYVPALYNEATIYGTTDPALAITTYRRVISLQPNAPTAYLNLGLLEAKAGLFDLAKQHLQKALDQDPSLVKSIPKDVFAKEPKSTPSPTASPK
jgi:Tfp pilus assembly protein PilF